MKSYLENYKEYVENIQSRKVVIFCAGNRCLEILREYFLYPFNDIAFICDNDSRKWGNKIFNIEICNPNRLKNEPDDYVVLVAVYNDFILKRIMQQLAEMKVRNYYSATILMFSNQIERFTPEGNPKYHEINTFKIINSHREQINKVREFLKDEKSKWIYDQFVEKVKYNIKDYSDIADDLYEHYFSDGIFQYKKDEILIDGGSFDGDDTIWFDNLLLQQGLRLKKSLCFEPDTNNFGNTYRNLEKYYNTRALLDGCRQCAEAERFTVFKAGLYEKQCGIGFYEYGAHSSRFTDGESTSSVNAVKLDDIAANENISFIKFDLEGADVPALRGAEETIKRCKPKLALSIYHNIEDLWEIPLMVKAMVPEYQLFIRHHTIYLWDKILYAAVNEDLL